MWKEQKNAACPSAVVVLLINEILIFESFTTRWIDKSMSFTSTRGWSFFFHVRRMCFSKHFDACPATILRKVCCRVVATRAQGLAGCYSRSTKAKSEDTLLGMAVYSSDLQTLKSVIKLALPQRRLPSKFKK
jgi:hypothetical protein